MGIGRRSPFLKRCWNKTLNEGKNIFELNKENLIDANPDLIISQETCEVCAAYTNQVKSALEILPNKPELYSMDPHNLKEIIQSVTKLGQILNKEKKSVEIVNSLERRIAPLIVRMSVLVTSNCFSNSILLSTREL